MYAIQGGWGVESPADMVTAVPRNFMMFPGAEFEIVSRADEAVTVRSNRPYKGTFPDDGEMFGVTVEDSAEMLSHFYTLVAEHEECRSPKPARATN